MKKGTLVDIKGYSEVFKAVNCNGEYVTVECMSEPREFTEGVLIRVEEFVSGVFVKTNLYTCKKENVSEIEMNDIDDIIETLADIPFLKEHIQRIEEELDNLRYKEQENENTIEMLLERLENCGEY